MNYNMTGVGSRFAPAAIGSAAGRSDSFKPPVAELTRAVAYLAILAALAFCASPVRYLLTQHLSAGTQIGGLALLAATVACYLRVMLGVMTGTAPVRAQVINLIALTVCTFIAPVPAGRSWLVLGFLLPAAAASAIRWPVGLWLGLGALPAAFATALSLGDSAAAAGRATAQDAVVASALAAVVMLAARAEEFGQLRGTIVTMTDGQAKTDERLRQANDLLDILGWRLSVIARMSDLIAHVSAQRPTVTSHVLVDINRLAVEWPGETVTGVAGQSAWELSAEIEAVRIVLAAAGIREADEVLADVPAACGDLLALAVHRAAQAMLRRHDATSCRIVALDDESRVKLTVTGNGSRPAPDGPEAADGLAALAGQIAAASGQCDYTDQDELFSLHVELPRAEPSVK